MKVGDLVLVKWIDAAMVHDALSLTETADQTPLALESAGFVTSVSKDTITVAMERCGEKSSFRHTLILPRKYITSIRKVR